MKFTFVKNEVTRCAVCKMSITGSYIRAYRPDSEETTFVCSYCGDNIINIFNENNK